MELGGVDVGDDGDGGVDLGLDDMLDVGEGGANGGVAGGTGALVGDHKLFVVEQV